MCIMDMPVGSPGTRVTDASGVWNQTWVFSKSTKCSAELSLQPSNLSGKINAFILHASIIETKGSQNNHLASVDLLVYLCLYNFLLYFKKTQIMAQHIDFTNGLKSTAVR